MNRIKARFLELKKSEKKALAVFVTAGFPEADSTPEIVDALEAGGADIVELGMPFSDPLADGPVIQQSSARALANGITLPKVLENVRAIRRLSEIPLVLMGYLNPILNFGDERFLDEAAASGVDGVILPEVPLEEFGRFERLLHDRDVCGILLVTPESSVDRIRAIDKASTGFLYCVSTRGVTGGQTQGEGQDYLARVRKEAGNPLMVGFGISTPDDARLFLGSSDGIIVGSAFLRFLDSSPHAVEIEVWARSFKEGMLHQK